MLKIENLRFTKINCMEFKNVIFNEDCLLTMKKMKDEGVKVDLIVTSPPYNTSRKGSSLTNACQNIRYDDFNDRKSDDEYRDWTLDVFSGIDSVLSENGCVLYNLSYSSENTHLMWLVVSDIISKTNFTIADCIVWKKKSASPNSCSSNKLTRICELVFVICRKSEFYTFRSNKKVTSKRDTGQLAYENIFNFIEAPNNDGCCDIHKATYSTILVRKLLDIYAKEGALVYDPFMGTGTTAVGCIKNKCNYIGSEISGRYVDIANSRIKQENSQLSLF